MERTRQRLIPQPTTIAGIQVRRQRCPARGPHKRVEVAGGHGVGTPRIRQRRRFKDLAVRLQLPKQPFRDGRAAILVLDVHEMQPPGLAVERLHGRHHAAPIPNRREHSGARDRGCWSGLAHKAMLSVVGRLATTRPLVGVRSRGRFTRQDCHIFGTTSEPRGGEAGELDRANLQCRVPATPWNGEPLLAHL